MITGCAMMNICTSARTRVLLPLCCVSGEGKAHSCIVCMPYFGENYSVSGFDMVCVLAGRLPIECCVQGI